MVVLAFEWLLMILTSHWTGSSHPVLLSVTTTLEISSGSKHVICQLESDKGPITLHTRSKRSNFVLDRSLPHSISGNIMFETKLPGAGKYSKCCHFYGMCNMIVDSRHA